MTKKLSDYTYEEYTEIYALLDGKTVYHSGDASYTDWPVDLLERDAFEALKIRMIELAADDPEEADDWESNFYEFRELGRDLLLMEKLHPYHKVEFQ